MTQNRQAQDICLLECGRCFNPVRFLLCEGRSLDDAMLDERKQLGERVEYHLCAHARNV